MFGAEIVRVPKRKPKRRDRHSSPCVVSGSPSCVYLKDGTMVVLCRYYGYRWLEVVPQSTIGAQEPLGRKKIKRAGPPHRRPTMPLTMCDSTTYGGFHIGNCKKCGRYGPLCNGNGICCGCGGFVEGRSRIGIPGKKVMCALEMSDRTVIKRLREAMKNHKPKKYPEVDRFIKKKRKMEKKQSFWDRMDPTVRKPLGDGTEYDEIERKASRRKKP